MAWSLFWGFLSQNKLRSVSARKRERDRCRKGAAERPGFTGIWSFELPAMADIGEKFLQPGGVSGRGMERAMVEEVQGFL
jgi:hypothetical protein